MRLPKETSELALRQKAAEEMRQKVRQFKQRTKILENTLTAFKVLKLREQGPFQPVEKDPEIDELDEVEELKAELEDDTSFTFKDFKEALTKIPNPVVILSAYALSKKVSSFFKIVGKTEHLRDFTDFKEKMNSENVKDIRFWSLYIKDYASVHYRGKTYDSGLLQKKIEKALLVLHAQYEKAVRLIHLDDLKQKTGGHVCPTTVLQSIQFLKSEKNSSSLAEVQNELVNHGMALSHKDHWLFKTGPQCSIVDILNQDPRQMVAWCLTLKILDHYRSQRNKVDFENAEIEKLYNEFYGIASFTLHDRKMLVKACARKMTSLQTTYQFRAGEQFYWIFELNMIVENYQRYRDLPVGAPTLNRTVRCYLLGDSSTAGFRVDNAHERFVNLIPGHFQRDEIVFEVINRSIVGYKLSDAASHLDKIVAEVERFRPDIIFIALSGNDIIKRSTETSYNKSFIEEIQRDAEKLIDGLRQKFPQKPIVWAGGIPQKIGIFKKFPQFKIDYETMFTDIGRSRGIEVAMLPPEILHESNTGPDGIHCTPEIQPAIAREAYQSLKPAVQRVINSRKPPLMRCSSEANLRTHGGRMGRQSEPNTLLTQYRRLGRSAIYSFDDNSIPAARSRSGSPSSGSPK